VGSYFHVFCPKGVTSKYRLIVYDSNKEPFIPLNEYYHDQIKRINESSVLAYLNTLKPFIWGLKSIHLSASLKVILWDIKCFIKFLANTSINKNKITFRVTK
jgi:hypothetical protein